MKLMIFGGAGTGKTTLASLLAKRTGFKHIDSDDYYWKKTEFPFQEKVPLNERYPYYKVRLAKDFPQF